MNKFLNSLQNKPYETRIKILWGTTIVIGVLIIVVWATTIKGTFKNNGPITIAPVVNQSRGNQTEIGLIKIERAEKTGESLKIYFNLYNDTDDILTFSKAENIILKTNDSSVPATSALDRQGLPLVQKILSRTQIFGTLLFNTATDPNPELSFNGMFFEKEPDLTLKQTFQLDIPSLEKTTEVRN